MEEATYQAIVSFLRSEGKEKRYPHEIETEQEVRRKRV